MTKATLFIVLLFFSSNIQAQTLTCLDVKNASFDKTVSNGVYASDFKWENGKTINVKFKDGTEIIKSKVKSYAKLWEKYANITFNFSQDHVPDILVTFHNADNPGYWSLIGSLSTANARRGIGTLNLEGFNDETEDVELRRVVVHEFGHALGLMHEHLNPDGGIKWNKPVVYNYYFTKYGWSKQKVDFNLFDRLSVTLSNRKYDPLSIMHYPILKEHTLDGFSVDWNVEMSSGDKEIISEMYPKPKTVNPVEPIKLSDITVGKIEIKHNVQRKFLNDNLFKGVEISFTVSTKNIRNQELLAYALFYKADETNPLKDIPNSKYYRTNDGDVWTATTFKVEAIDLSSFRGTMWIPYKELNLPVGDFRLKFSFQLAINNGLVLYDGGYYFFSYKRSKDDDLDDRLLQIPERLQKNN